MNWEMITNYILFGTAAAFIIYDVWVIKNHGSRASISVRLVKLSKRYLLIPVVIGILIGHFFFPLYADCM